jgi:hypothetical protein
MLNTPKCYTRKCKWFSGVKQPDGDELNEFNYCRAFPDGIPTSIAYGDDLHLVVIEGQEGDYTYEERS